MSSTADANAKRAEAEQYAALLEEAKRLKGTSLWRDAGKRLRRNRMAMLSLCYLVLLGLVAIFTPLLPLQSPTEMDFKSRCFLPPNLQPIHLTVREEITEHRRLVKEKEDELAQLTDEQERQAAQNTLTHMGTQDPISRKWNRPGSIDRGLIRLRLAIFGDWCIPSIFGTDNVGRDLLSRLCWGARVSLMVGVVASLVSMVIGVFYGATAGFLGGWVDSVMMRIVDVLYSIPFIFVVIFLITFLNQDEGKSSENQLTLFFIVIGAIYWLTMSRVVRGQVISIKQEQFVDAARTVGASQFRIIVRHLVPNVMSIVIVYLTLTIPAVMLFEAFLSFLGLGVTAPDVSWGVLANEGIKVITPLRIDWWLILFPGLALALTLLALNFLGDGLRDALDPRMKNR